MKKSGFIKLQFIAGIIIACSILIGSFIYYLKEQQIYTENALIYTDTFQQKSSLAKDLKIDLRTMNYAKYGLFSDERASNLSQLQASKEAAQEKITQLQLPNPLYTEPPQQIEKISTLLDDSSQNNSILEEALSNSNLQERHHATLKEEAIIDKQVNHAIRALSDLTREKIAEEQAKLHQEIKVVVPLFIVALLVILLILYRIYQILETVRTFARKEKQANKEYLTAQKHIENNNWILESLNDIHIRISGIDDVQKISENSLETISKAFGNTFYAGAIYVKSKDTQTFSSMAAKALDAAHTRHRFKVGEGILGEAVKKNSIRILNNVENENIHLATTFIESISPTVILVPFYEDSVPLGLIELLVDIPQQDIPRTKEYLTRIAKTIASAIRFGQTHTMIEDLLEKTQVQTEELEAQQEELRITNEELIHKTNLLEASEEELRVQQEELSQTNTELNIKAEELQRRNIDLSEAQNTVELKIKEVEQASRYKSEFMANMSHELRTPLNSILILAKLLQDNKGENLTEEQTKYASVIHSAGSDLLELINELLDLAKIEAGKIDIQREAISAQNFTKNLHDLFKEIAEQKNIDFTCETVDFPEYFVSDEYRIEQVLKNFLSNAFKFTSEKGKVHLTFKKIDEELYFSVEDTGKGISKEKQKLIFEAFRQEDGSTSRQFGGTGLGLSISKEIANLLNGRIELSSEPGKGSTFSFIISYEAENTQNKKEKAKSDKKEAHTADEKPVQVESRNQDSKQVQGDRTILIVEDNVDFAEILKDYASLYGFKAKVAYDGVEALRAAKQIQPDAIILDVFLPVYGGWEVLRFLKEDPDTRDIPVHMMSATTYDLKDIADKGAIGFLPKPVSEESLEEAFSNIIRNVNDKPGKVLLVEDQEVLSDILKKLFAEHNIQVTQAYTIESALDNLKKDGQIGCIVLDINLPDGDGLDLLDKIKANPTYRHIPVVINTAQNLSKEQTERIARHSTAAILKDGNSTNRLIDEVNLFLNKINQSDYAPTKHIAALEKRRDTDYVSNAVLKDKRVLVVDDDMRNVFALTTALQDEDMKIEIANNGKEALELLENEENHFDVVLMDIMMPEMDGYEAITEIRKNNRHTRLPIIAVTAKAMKEDREKTLQVGANDYISKPIDINKLVSLMKVWLS